jgi:hypothetical protein
MSISRRLPEVPTSHVACDVLPMKISLFWDVAPFNFVETNRRFKGAYYFQHEHLHDRGITHLWNEGQFPRDYTGQQHSRLKQS